MVAVQANSSQLTIRLCEGRFTATHDVTIGVEFGSRIVPVGPPASDSLEIDLDDPSVSQSDPTPTVSNGSTPVNGKGSQSKNKPTGLPPPPKKPSSPPVQKRMKLSLWDTAGQETYKSITRSYFRGASGALLVFDITRPSTFASLTQWLQDLHQIAEEGIVVVLVGNKSDLAQDEVSNKRRVTRQEAEEWCRQHGVIRYVETSAKSGDGVERAFLEVAERIYRKILANQYDLNDRRSGVKGYGATAGGGSRGAPRTVALGLNDAMGNGGKGWTGGCC